VRDIPAAEAERWIEAVQRDWRTAGLAPLEYALCAYAEKLTREPWAMQRADVENRVADALHIDLEPGMPPYPPA
jgi:hypothetical protein